jgi:hypothetical protein
MIFKLMLSSGWIWMGGMQDVTAELFTRGWHPRAPEKKIIESGKYPGGLLVTLG